MALTAEEKERIMQARETERVATCKTRLYRAVVDGKGVTMLSLTGLSPSQAEAYCRGIFGDRLQRFEPLNQIANIN